MLLEKSIICKYFKNAFHPLKCIMKLKYSYSNLLVIYFVLQSMLIAPISYQLFSLDYVNLNYVFPNHIEAIDKETYLALNQGEIKEGKFFGKPITIESENSIITVLPSKDELSKIKEMKKNKVILTRTKLILQSKLNSPIEMSLSKNINLSKLNTLHDVQKFISENLYRENRLILFLILLFLCVAYIQFTNIVFSIFIIFYLKSMSKAMNLPIRSIKGCLSVIVNSQFWPSILSSILIWRYFNLIGSVIIISIGSLLIILFSVLNSKINIDKEGLTK